MTTLGRQYDDITVADGYAARERLIERVRATQETPMPIRPENKSRYPKNWKAIRAAILERAQHRCEGSPAYPDCRATNGERHPVTGSRVVLTIAHLDHVPEHCELENLRAWCQRCHLTYDGRHHAETRILRNRRYVQHRLW